MHRVVRGALSALTILLSFQEVSQPHQLGMNLETIHPMASQIIFVDAMKRSSRWFPFELIEGGAWDVPVDIPLSPDGYPLELPYDPPGGTAPVGAATLLFNQMAGEYPSGTYTLLFDGSGFMVVGAGEVEEAYFQGGEYTIDIDSSNASDVLLLLIDSDPADPIRNIRFVLPGFREVHESSPFYPPFIEKLSPFSVIRFSQTMRTNGGDYPCDNGVLPTDGDCAKIWANRPLPTDRTQASPRGVALEYVIDLANQVGFSPWLCVQHGADDNYVRELATLVESRLAPGLKCHVELSNEVWNFSADYPQSLWAEASGLAQGLSTDPTLARIFFVAKRSAEVFRLFETAFGVSAVDRLVKVLPGHIANPWQNEQQLTAFSDPILNPHGVQADAFAVGAYFGNVVGDEIVHEGRAEIATISEVLDRGRNNLTIDRPDPFAPGEMILSLANMVSLAKTLTDAHGVSLVAYEGGQALHERHEFNNNPILGQTMVDANRDPAMKMIYREMLETWELHGGGLFLHYSLIHRPTIHFGSYGSLEWTDQAEENSPKYQALLDWIEIH